MYLRRNQQSFFIILACALPVAAGPDFLFLLSHLASTPILNLLVYEEANLLKQASSLFFLFLFFLTLARLQKPAIIGEPLNSYLKSLPVNELTTWKVNWKIIGISNNLAWIFIFLPTFVFPYSSRNGLDVLLFSVNLSAISILIIYCQSLLLFTPHLLLIIGFPLALLFLLFIQIENTYAAIATSLSYIFIVLMLMKNTPYIEATTSKLGHSQKSARSSTYSPAIISPLFKIYLKIILQENLPKTLFLYACYGIISYATCYFVNHNGDLPYFQIFIVLLTYLLSNFFTMFFEARKDMQIYLKSLPITRHFFMIWDCSFIFFQSVLGSLPILIYINYAHAGKFNFPAYAILMLATLPMLLLLFFSRVSLKKNGATAGFSIFILWILIFIQVKG